MSRILVTELDNSLPGSAREERPVRGHSLVVGYHRPPMHWNGAVWQPPASPNGILPTLTSAFTDGLPGVWVAALAGGDRRATGPHPTELPLSLVPLSSAEWTGYFHRACKETLWPVLMSEPERSVFAGQAWHDFRTVNARFAEHISTEAAPGATVWLHDYNLWLVPGLLRTARPDLRTGLFHHTPFPSPEVFATLPVAAELRASLACLDWAGFHTGVFADRFRRTLADADGQDEADGPDGPDEPLRIEAPRIEVPRIEVHPLGIDRGAVERLAAGRTIRRRPAGTHLVLSVERLDYAKAPVQKVDAIDHLLTRRPDLRGKLSFRLVCPPPEPGITAYDTTRRRLEQRVAEVNASWAERSWQPIDYLPRSLSDSRVIEEYLAADVLWVTSLQDGMNLTAKEFVAAQAAHPRHGARGPGVLVLSRHAGAATELGPAALLTDPHSPGDLSSVLARALALTPAERRTRMAALAGLLGHERPADWANRIVHAIGQCGPPRQVGGHARRAEPTMGGC
ncbi:trehalose-6-phosphate synthase [Kitasatospora sp. NBC_01250]|uniref:alpha,alpha-trehalose-phosphate synthase (UDP-forming) n=1 Tax=Kitasatospora sp. NBC_01250 TaxID=2903571 RepID=UPI002E31C2FC|nr:trehalose-6-phosphate synthase [Kitasatospora sp. NBC_01250]